jgi:hypothetical protein
MNPSHHDLPLWWAAAPVVVCPALLVVAVDYIDVWLLRYALLALMIYYHPLTTMGVIRKIAIFVRAGYLTKIR